jgi:hypothetical protein
MELARKRSLAKCSFELDILPLDLAALGIAFLFVSAWTVGFEKFQFLECVKE